MKSIYYFYYTFLDKVKNNDPHYAAILAISAIELLILNSLATYILPLLYIKLDVFWILFVLTSLFNYVYFAKLNNMDKYIKHPKYIFNNYYVSLFASIAFILLGIVAVFVWPILQ